MRGLRGSCYLPWMRADQGIATAPPLTAGAARAGRSRGPANLLCSRRPEEGDGLPLSLSLCVWLTGGPG
jgi:hypothetical protein